MEWYHIRLYISQTLDENNFNFIGGSIKKFL